MTTTLLWIWFVTLAARVVSNVTEIGHPPRPSNLSQGARDRVIAVAVGLNVALLASILYALGRPF